jgi:hypothetical protein
MLMNYFFFFNYIYYIHTNNKKIFLTCIEKMILKMCFWSWVTKYYDENFFKN